MSRALATTLPVSVVVVSRGRPEALCRCLLGLSQVQYAPFEIIVVADPQGLEAIATLSFAQRLKTVAFDQPNISAARNLGIGQAAGEVVAFIDDDAVPEPTWLRYLTAPCTHEDVAAMTGFVRGRNGISFQNRARGLDERGFPHPIDVDPQETTILRPPKGRAVKTEGTNMAFRRDILVELGGFDTAFHYYLDETDLNMRLARAGHATAIVPLAEVHHGYAANAMRGSNRVPKDLFDIGASWAIFQRKHVPQADRSDQYAEIRQNERSRALQHMVRGTLEPGQVRRLLARLDEGYAQGQSRPLGHARLAKHSASPFEQFPSLPRSTSFEAVRYFGRKPALEKAAESANTKIVTLLILSPTSLFHKVSFTNEGVWTQTGGVFGRSERTGGLVKWTTFRRRADQERKRIALQRGLNP